MARQRHAWPPAQLEAARRVYEGLVIDGEAGRSRFRAGSQDRRQRLEPVDHGRAGRRRGRGVPAWRAGRTPSFRTPVTPSAHFAFGNGVMKYLVFHDPDWGLLDV